MQADKKTISAWAFYDWANSAYPLVITTAIFPMFYEAVTSSTVNGEESDVLIFFGRHFRNTEIYSYVMAFSFLVVCFISPILSGVSDYTDQKKKFLKFFCYLGAVSCAALYFFDPSHLEISMIPVALASIGFWGSMVFYNAYLPELVPTEMQDAASAKGYALGYIGSSILLIGNLIGIMVFDMNPKYAFLSVAVWWAGFSQITYARLPKGGIKSHATENRFTKGWKELLKVWRQLKSNLLLKRYLLSFFVFSMGVQTIMLMATLFAAKEVDWGTDGAKTGLIISVLIIQFIAIAGAYFFSWLSAKIGNIKALMLNLTVWIGVCSAAYFVYTPTGFYMLAAVVGLIMGGVQSLSRSTYSKMLPKTEDHASFFSFYDVLEKFGIVIGTFSYGFIEGVTGSMRNSIFALAVFFVVGFVLLWWVSKIKIAAPAEK